MRSGKLVLIEKNIKELVRLVESLEESSPNYWVDLCEIRTQRCIELIDELNDAGFDFACQEKKFHAELKHIVCYIGLSGNLPLVNKLLSVGLPVDFVSALDLTLLQLATRYGYLNCVKAMLEAGADVTVLDSSRRSLLHLAMYAGDREIVDLLVSHGAPINHLDDEQMTPLDLLLFMTAREAETSSCKYMNIEKLKIILKHLLNAKIFEYHQEWMTYADDLGALTEFSGNRGKNLEFLTALSTIFSKVTGSNKEPFIKSLMQAVEQNLYLSPHEIVSKWFERQSSNPFAIIFDYRKTSFKSIFKLPTDTFKEFQKYLGYQVLMKFVTRGKELDNVQEKLFDLNGKQDDSHLARLPAELLVNVGKFVQSSIVKRA